MSWVVAAVTVGWFLAHRCVQVGRFLVSSRMHNSPIIIANLVRKVLLCVMRLLSLALEEGAYA